MEKSYLGYLIRPQLYAEVALQNLFALRLAPKLAVLVVIEAPRLVVSVGVLYLFAISYSAAVKGKLIRVGVSRFFVAFEPSPRFESQRRSSVRRRIAACVVDYAFSVIAQKLVFPTACTVDVLLRRRCRFVVKLLRRGVGVFLPFRYVAARVVTVRPGFPQSFVVLSRQTVQLVVLVSAVVIIIPCTFFLVKYVLEFLFLYYNYYFIKQIVKNKTPQRAFCFEIKSFFLFLGK